jgi:hypothetical protein
MQVRATREPMRVRAAAGFDRQRPGPTVPRGSATYKTPRSHYTLHCFFPLV